MNTEIVNVESPKVMTISIYSNIKQKLNFLQQCIKSDKDADTAKLYIECSTEVVERDDGEIKEVKRVRFSVDLQTWTDISILNPDGDILEKNISVNLYDMYNIVNSCTDDVVSLWIDSSEEGHSLVINSYYNPELDYDEMEARLKIIDYAFEPFTYTVSLPQRLIGQLYLDNLALWHISSELNTERRVDNITCHVINGKPSFQSEYNGIKTVLSVKHVPSMQPESNFSFTIPFHAFNLMSSTGKIDALCFNVYEDQITVEGDGYEFCIPKLSSPEPITFNDTEYLDYFVIESKLALETFDLINRLNKPSPVSTITIEKVDDITADFTVEYQGRYSVSLRPNLAMLSDAIMRIDGDIMQEFFTNINVDAVRVKIVSQEKNQLFLSYDNGVVVKQMMYDHAQFDIYRKSLIK